MAAGAPLTKLLALDHGCQVKQLKAKTASTERHDALQKQEMIASYDSRSFPKTLEVLHDGPIWVGDDFRNTRAEISGRGPFTNIG